MRVKNFLKECRGDDMRVKNFVYFVSLFLLCSPLYAKQEGATNTSKQGNATANATVQKQSAKKQELPPPPIPFSEVYRHEIPDAPVKIEEVQDLYEIPEEVLKDFLKKRDRLNPLLRDYKNIKIKPFQMQFLKPTNYFYYSPHIPVLMTFPEEIHRVIVTNVAQNTVFYEDNYLVALPPEPSTDLFTFVVVFKSGKAHYFLGERYVSKPNEKVVIPYFAFIKEEQLTPHNLIQAYFKKYRRCPDNNEIIKAGGRYYQIKVEQTSLFTRETTVHFCGRFYSVKLLNYPEG